MSTYRTQSRDTSRAAEAVQIEIWRRMSPAAKLALVESMRRDADGLAEAGIRLRHPGASDREVFLRRVALSLDRPTMVRVFGWDPESDGR